MSDSNWGKFLTKRFGLILGLFLAGAFTLLVIETAWLHQRELYDEAASNATNYAERADDNISVECVGLTGQALENCTQPIKDAARKDQREEYDLYSQRAMALWTAVMGGMAVVGVSLSGVGVFLVWTTFRETRRAADEAERNVQAFIDAEKARISVVGDRGMVRINDDFYSLNLNIRNYGRSACLIKKIQYASLADDSWHGDFNGIDSRSKDVHVHVIPNAESHKDMGRIMFPVGSRYAALTITYETQFNRNCAAYFLWKLSGPENGANIQIKKRQIPPDWPENT